MRGGLEKVGDRDDSRFIFRIQFVRDIITNVNEFRRGLLLAVLQETFAFVSKGTLVVLLLVALMAQRL